MVFVLVRVAAVRSQMISGVETVLVLGGAEMVLYVVVYTSFWYHIIILLIVLEFIMLKNFLLIMVLISISSVESAFIFFFSVLAVREARLGISLLAVLSRAHGNDY